MAAASASGWDFLDLRVLRTQTLGPSMRRVVLGGPDVDRFRSGGRDQRFKLFLPQPGEPAPLVPTWAGPDWYAEWRHMEPSRRAVMRSYTVRAQRPGELAVDFALHDGTGPAGRWAATAAPGDHVVALGPTDPDNAGIDFRPPQGTRWVLLAADLTALPAVAGIVSWLGAAHPELPVRAWIEVPFERDRQELVSQSADLTVRWVARGGLPGAVVTTQGLPAGTPYAWLAGEAGCVRDLRRHLLRERGFERSQVTFTGYWRRGASEEDLLTEVA
ncbi:siderophore-interacting protein [Streptacidiphilus jiangxiensis]|uniref:NADPH-dependent ferric siderophore reductase, contains FAD-binding and SIP domains n=1 Tax=Streptacidiphilus jiangxiensis TaxID=235985 RepID=A0A1H7UPT7_STRJI|nr:siderophore-interacting protein [Streptacidiphilus jiangxiensis]SEL98745.1 NADPH-dependent ferric siderophore reductase, contains FAD-binding and SIP domains [Streptacidiphilus jiangxiensis]